MSDYDLSRTDESALTTNVTPGSTVTENGLVPSPPTSTAAFADTASPQYTEQVVSSRPVRWWEPVYVFFITFIIFALAAPRIVTFLSPTTGDEPFYLMTAISIWRDHDINECNNYRQRDEAALYPATWVNDNQLPFGWLGWNAAPYPLPPHPAKIVPNTRRCFGTDVANLQRAIPDTRFPLPANGTENELYSKHGLGLALLVALPFNLGGRLSVVFFLNVLGALLAANIYLFAREGLGKIAPALLTWLAFTFTVPVMPYSFLIFPELPAALLTLYTFRRIWIGRNSGLQLALIGFSIAFLPWLHYRFVPICAGLFLFLLYRMYMNKQRPIDDRVKDLSVVLAPVIVSAIWLGAYFYFLYGQPYPNGSDHAGISDAAGTLRGAVGSFLDEQWGLLVSSPIFILGVVGVLLMAALKPWRKDLLWIAIVFVPYFALIANYAQWWGEWCPPARYLTSVLPLLALPFAVALDRIKGFVYKGVYAVLLLFSLGTMGGFVFQPQWMYNQPNGSSQLFLHGLPTLISKLPVSMQFDLDLTKFFPTFVVPYFAYASQGPESGDQWSALAWQKSIWPLVIITAIVAFCLVLALLQNRNRRSLYRDGAAGAGAALDYGPDPLYAEDFVIPEEVRTQPEASMSGEPAKVDVVPQPQAGDSRP